MRAGSQATVRKRAFVMIVDSVLDKNHRQSTLSICNVGPYDLDTTMANPMNQIIWTLNIRHEDQTLLRSDLSKKIPVEILHESVQFLP